MEKTKLLSVMRFWLLGTFFIVVSATTAYAWVYSQHDLLLAVQSVIPILGVTGVLCVVWYFVYKMYVQTKG